MNKKRFVIIGEQRSGTIALGDMLNSHPDIHVFGELFLDFPADDNKHSYFEFVAKQSKRGIDRFYPNFNFIQKNLCDFLEHLEADSAKSTWGFHLKYDQIYYIPELIKHIQEMNFVCIHVIRPKVLDVLLSQITLRFRHLAGLTSHTPIDQSENATLFVELPDNEVLIRMGLDIVNRVNIHRDILQRSFNDNYIESIYPLMLARDKSCGYIEILEKLGVRDFELFSTIKKSSNEATIIYSDDSFMSDSRLISINIDVNR